MSHRKVTCRFWGVVEGDATGANIIFEKAQVTGIAVDIDSESVNSCSVTNGNIDAVNLSVAGIVNGNIKVVDHVNIADFSAVTGDIDAGRIPISGGATINGKSKIYK